MEEGKEVIGIRVGSKDLNMEDDMKRSGLRVIEGWRREEWVEGEVRRG